MSAEDSTVSEERKHTPGPWTIDYQPAESPNVWIRSDGNSGIAKIECCDYGDGKGEVLTEEDFSNARLIAAAPELLAERDALKAQNAELADLVNEVLRAGNANTRAVKELMRQAGTSWAKRARAALSHTKE